MKITKLALLVLLCAMLILTGCSGSAEESQSVESTEPEQSSSSTVESSKEEPIQDTSSQEEESEPEAVPAAAQTPKTEQPPAATPAASTVIVTPEPSIKPFALDMSASFMLYAYNGPKQGYIRMGNPYWSEQGGEQPELEAAIAAINGLPELEEAEEVPFWATPYELMIVEDNYAKFRYFLYSDIFGEGEDTYKIFEANGTAYKINNEQYEALKAVITAGSLMDQPAIPAWFVYMNPAKAVSVQCTDENGAMQEISQQSVRTVTSFLKHSIFSLRAETYRPETIDFSGMPFRAVYTFDTGTVYTVAISDILDEAGNVTLYLECSTMDYACEYTIPAWPSSFIKDTQMGIYGQAIPYTVPFAG